MHIKTAFEKSELTEFWIHTAQFFIQKKQKRFLEEIDSKIFFKIYMAFEKAASQARGQKKLVSKWFTNSEKWLENVYLINP